MCNIEFQLVVSVCLGDVDYSEFSGVVVTFLAGQTEVFFPIGTRQDGVQEGEESFTATLSSPTGANLGEAVSATVLITDGKC